MRKDAESLEIAQRVINSTLEVFNEKGLKFTMDDVAKNIRMSKKTIYRVFRDKDEIFTTMVDYIFDDIKTAEKEVLEDESLSTVEKLRKLLGVMPQTYADINFSRLNGLRNRYPKIYKKVETRIESGWDDTIKLIEQGIEEGVIRPVSVPIVKMMMEATLEHFFQRDDLVENNINYTDALQEVVSVLIDGIVVK